MWHTQTHDHTHTRMRARQMLQAISVRKMPHLCFSVSNQCAFFLHTQANVLVFRL